MESDASMTHSDGEFDDKSIARSEYSVTVPYCNINVVRRVTDMINNIAKIYEVTDAAMISTIKAACLMVGAATVFYILISLGLDVPKIYTIFFNAVGTYGSCGFLAASSIWAVLKVAKKIIVV